MLDFGQELTPLAKCQFEACHRPDIPIASISANGDGNVLAFSGRIHIAGVDRVFLRVSGLHFQFLPKTYRRSSNGSCPSSETYSRHPLEPATKPSMRSIA